MEGRVSNLISLSSAVIVAIGENTHESEAVNWEIDEAHYQGKMVIGILLHRDEEHETPPAMYEDDDITYWDTAEIARLLEDFE